MTGLTFASIDLSKLHGGTFLFDTKIMCRLKIFFYLLASKSFLLMNKCVHFETARNFNRSCRKSNKFRNLHMQILQVRSK